MDGIITGLLVNGKEYANGAVVDADANEEIVLQIGLQNTTACQWLSSGTGSVSLISDDGNFKLDIPHNMAKRDRVTLTVTLSNQCQYITAKLVAADRGIFGDRLSLQINRT